MCIHITIPIHKANDGPPKLSSMLKQSVQENERIADEKNKNDLKLIKEFEEYEIKYLEMKESIEQSKQNR